MENDLFQSKTTQKRQKLSKIKEKFFISSSKTPQNNKKNRLNWNFLANILVYVQNL